MNELFEKREPVDMSPAAIAQRLRELQQLYLFSLSLSRARFVDETEQRNADAVKAIHGIGSARDASMTKSPTPSTIAQPPM